jgi:hypothetical protein
MSSGVTRRRGTARFFSKRARTAEPPGLPTKTNLDLRKFSFQPSLINGSGDLYVWYDNRREHGDLFEEPDGGSLVSQKADLECGRLLSSLHCRRVPDLLHVVWYDETPVEI